MLSNEFICKKIDIQAPNNKTPKVLVGSKMQMTHLVFYY